MRSARASEPPGALVCHQNALWAPRRVAEVWGGEVTPVITVADGRVASRSIRLDAGRGSWRGLRFAYGKNMAGCTRTVLGRDVHTAPYGFGAGPPVTDEDGSYEAGHRRELTFGEVNGGLSCVADEAAREVWGRWNAERPHRALPQGLSAAASVTVVESTVTTAIDDLDELAELDF